MSRLNRISNITGMISSGPVSGSSVSISQKLFSETGLVKFSHGVGALMPILLKSLRKLEGIVRKEMKAVSAEEFMLPILTQSDLFVTSGRHNLPDIIKVQINEEKSFILSPTCEEAMTHILSHQKTLNYKKLPIRLFQIGSKFRAEKRPKSGLLRAHEFLMKDLYCFDADEESSEKCYQEVINQYHHFFNLLNVPFMCVESSTGDIGGLKSHEFHFPSEAGEDSLVSCGNCGHIHNLETTEGDVRNKCPKCQSDVTIINGIEVGHAFKLGTKYTKPLGATYLKKGDKPEVLQMCSFGLGLTRILAACVEVLSTPDAIRWPVAIAPYLVCIVPPKAGSKEEAFVKDTAQVIYQNLNQVFEDDIVIDDRSQFTVGKRVQMNNKMGFPFQVVLGKNLLDSPPSVEVIDINSNSGDIVQIPDVCQFIIDKLHGNQKNQKGKEKLTV